MKVCLLELIQKGGMVHYASKLANEISNQNNMDVSIIIPEGTDCSDFNSNIIVKKIPVIGRHPFRIDLILKNIIDINPDIVHIIIRHPFIIPILPILKFKNYPILLTVHDVNPHLGEKNKWISNISSSITIRYSERVFVLGEILKLELMKRNVSEKKIIPVVLGNLSFFTNSEKEKNDETNTVLFFGRILEYKGLEYLIEAEPIISSIIPDLKIIIAGEGDMAQYRKLIKNAERFEIINEYIPDEIVPKLFQRSALVAIPYVEASNSGIISIAYSFQKPVVATNLGCLPEVVDDQITGLIVPPRNSKALAEAIIMILKNKSMKMEMGQNAYKKVVKELSWESAARDVINAYKAVI